jgi:hypothetical protein
MRTPVLRIELVAIALMSLCIQVHAQSRGPTAQDLRERAKAARSPEARQKKIEEADAWLRRLVGRFQIKVSSMNSPLIESCGIPEDKSYRQCSAPDRIDMSRMGRTFEGTGQCVVHGTGPGVKCLLDDFYGPDGEWKSGMFKVILFGLDPDDPGVRMLLIGGGGNMAGRGTLSGATATFSQGCAGTGADSLQSCSRTLRIRTLEGGKGFEMTTTMDFRPPNGNVRIGTPGGERFEFTRIP